MLSLALSLWLAALPAPAAAPKPPEDCDALYESRAFDRALACYRAQEEWAMVAILQLNGEGTPVDVPGARASFRRLVGDGGFVDGDAQALDEILKAREGRLKPAARHIDFCHDVAMVTPSLAYCARREADRRTRNDDIRLAVLRVRFEPDARPLFDAAMAAFRAFVDAEGARTYEKYIDGTIRNQAAISEETFVRANFMAEIERTADRSGTGPVAGARPFADADRALNAAYRDDIRGGTPDYKAKSRATQHAWVRYRDALAKLAAARWPGAPEVEARTQALVTEDRIRELTPGEGDIR